MRYAMTTETTRRTLKSRIADWRIRSEADRASDNPNTVQEQDDRNPMNHWRVTLKMGRRRLTVPFSANALITPDAHDVLNCLALDSSGWENACGGFENWCNEYGYDTDSRRAERTYAAVGRQAGRLRQFLGEERYAMLLWHTDE